MFAKKLSIVLSMVAVLKLECTLRNEARDLLDHPEQRMTGLTLPHPFVTQAAKNLVASKPIMPNYYTGYWGSLMKGASSVFSSITEPISTLLGQSSSGARQVVLSKPIELANINKYPSSLTYNQGALNSCAHNAMALIIAYLSVQNSQQPTDFLSNPQGLRASRLYLYYNTRYEECKLSGNFSQMDVDYGSSLEGALLAADKYGIPPENFLAKFEYGFTYTGWPYDVSKYKSQPDAESYRMALDSNFFGVSTQNGVNLYRAVSQNLRYTDLITPHLNTEHLKGQLTLNTAAEKVAIVNAFVTALTNNNPIYFGTLIESDFMNARGGFVPMPNISTFDPIGGMPL